VALQTAGVPPDGGTPAAAAAAGGGMEGAGTHCSHQELKTMNVSDYVHTGSHENMEEPLHLTLDSCMQM
jgi:hypothetical protein